MDNATEVTQLLSPEFAASVQVYIYLYGIPCMALPGMVMCALSFVIFTHRRMRISFNIYLATLCCFGFALLFSSTLLYPTIILCSFYGWAPSCSVLPYVIISMLPLSLVAQTGSICTCIAITVDRFLVVRFPLKSRTWCNTGRAIKVVYAICAWSLLYRSPTLFEWQITDRIGNHTLNHTYALPTALRQNQVYTLIRNLAYTMLMFVVPWLVMIVLNVYIIVAVRRAYTQRTVLTHSHQLLGAKGALDSASTRRATATHSDRERHMSIMAVCIIVAFLGCNLLTTLNNVYEYFFGMTRDPLYRISIYLGNLLTCLNTILNIPVYFAGPRFRRMAVHIFCPGLDRGGDPSSMARYNYNNNTATGLGTDPVSRTMPCHNRYANRAPHKPAAAAQRSAQSDWSSLVSSPEQHRSLSMQLPAGNCVKQMHVSSRVRHNQQPQQQQSPSQYTTRPHSTFTVLNSTDKTMPQSPLATPTAASPGPTDQLLIHHEEDGEKQL